MEAESREQPSSQKYVGRKIKEAAKKRRKSPFDQETPPTLPALRCKYGGNILGEGSQESHDPSEAKSSQAANSQNRMILRINGSNPRARQG
jgi:hypothetical protein